MKLILQADGLEITKEITTPEDFALAMHLFNSKEEKPELKLVPFLAWESSNK